MAVYVLSGALAALAGIISASRTGVGSGSIGVGAELDVIAAVVIGGASLSGGVGSIEHIDEVREAGDKCPGIVGAIVGKAIYEGKVDVAEALRRLRG